MKNHFNLIIQLNAISVLWKYAFTFRHYEAIKKRNAIKPSPFSSSPVVDMLDFLSLIFWNILVRSSIEEKCLIKRREKVNFLPFLFYLFDCVFRDSRLSVEFVCPPSFLIPYRKLLTRMIENR